MQTAGPHAQGLRLAESRMRPEHSSPTSAQLTRLPHENGCLRSALEEEKTFETGDNHEKPTESRVDSGQP